MIETRKREHSRKPDEQYDLIEACSPGPRLELFARHPRDGWTVWGEESDEGVTPRGKVHRGYAGGPMIASVLAPHQRLTQDDQQALGKKLRIEYERGTSIRDLALQTEYSIRRVRTLLVDAGTTFRKRGKRYAG